MKNIKREYYLKKIEPFIGKGLIKVIIGQRRVGKSYLLLQIMEMVKERDSSSNNILIDKEKYDFDEIKDYKDLIEYVQKNLFTNKKNNIFIDEIQDIEHF